VVAAGVPDDHGCLADGLLALHQATGEPRWLDAATGLLDVALEHFAHGGPGAFRDTTDDAETLLHRPRELTDNATPCGNSALASALLSASVLVAEGGRYRRVAEAAVHGAGTLAGKHPRYAGHWLTVGETLVRGPLQVAVAGGPGPLLDHARRVAPGGTVVPPTLPASRCWPTAPWWTAARRPTYAAASSATTRSRPRKS
jgi:uncharacterized protein YyaL (SSP411 family)